MTTPIPASSRASDVESSKRIIYPPLAAHEVLRQPLTRGEQAVLSLFDRALPAGWEIYVQPHLNGLRPDFVLLHPEIGVAVFEVKDWDLDAMRYFIKEERGHPKLWAERNGKSFCHQSQEPISKVKLYKKEIFDLYCPRLASRFGWAAVTAGVIFPFARKDRVLELLSPFRSFDDKDPNGKYEPISGREEILAGDLSAVFPEAARSQSRVMSPDLAADLRGWLVEPDFAATQRKPLELNTKQRNLAAGRTPTGYRRIKGPAGSGKSLVLAARAARLAAEGKSVLIATYNITLWHYLQDLVAREAQRPGWKDHIRFTNFHHWCKMVCHEVGWGAQYNALFQGLSNSEGAAEQSAAFKEIMDHRLPALAAEAVCQSGACHYDAILVDEGQDYRPEHWNILRRALKPGGEAMLVADSTQDVYGTAGAWTDQAMTGAGFVGVPAQLDICYRLPSSATEVARRFAEQFLPGHTRDLPWPDQGSLELDPCTLRWVQCDAEAGVDACLGAIHDMMKRTGERGLANADITLLTADLRSGHEITARLYKNNVRTVNTFASSSQERRRQKMAFWMGDARVKATTLHSFKSWESRMLVIYAPHAASAESLALIYTGLTRLKRSPEGSWLTVVCSASDLAAFGRTWPEQVEFQSHPVIAE